MSDKDNINENLPLMVNGKLDEEEISELKAQNSERPSLQKEADFLVALRKGIQEDQPLPGEVGLARLKRDIQKEQARKTLPGGKKVSPLWKTAAIAVCVLFAAQTIWLAPTAVQIPSADITTLAGNEVSSGPKIKVIFSESITLSQLREALLSVDGTIVDGPSALGILTLALPKNKNSKEVILKLQENEFVIEVSGS